MSGAERFAMAVAKLAAVYRVTVDPLLVESYWEALQGWPLEGLEGGARTIIREAKFFPRPVEWAEAAEDWLKERRSLEQSKRLALEQSNAPPLTRDDVQKLIADLNDKLGWPR